MNGFGGHLRLRVLFCTCLLGVAALGGGLGSRARSAAVPSYTDDGRLQLPSDYREWVYLSSGLDMSYTPRSSGASGHSMFDNVFVNPEAYRSFLQTGTWPNKTMLALELRGADKNASINKAGYFQDQSVMGVELHIKDAARGGWAFYQFDSAAPAKMVPKGANCYSCHRDHGVVDTTFVQFYPTLIPVAKKKNTLRFDVKQNGTKPVQ